MRAARQPSLDPRRLVGGIIVHDDMYVGACGHVPVDLFEKVQKLGRAVAFVALADDGTGGDIQRGEKRCGTVADVRSPFGIPI